MTEPTATSAEPILLPNPLLDLHRQTDAEFQNYDTLEIVSTFGEPQAEYAALHKSCGLMDLPHRGLVELTGKDRLTFLNNLLTNEVWSKQTKTGIQAGHGVYAFLLTANGKIVSDLNVIERGDTTLLELDARLIPRLLKALDRYLFAEQVKLTSRVGTLHELALLGPGAPAVLDAAAGANVAELPPNHSTQVSLFGVETIVWRDDPCGAPGLHLLIPTDQASAVWKQLVANFGELVAHARRPLRPVGWAAFNTVRIEAGRPFFGIDFDGTTLPAETGEATFNRAVSMTKGCYPGQEIVARMFARKQSAKQLVGLKLPGEMLPMAGSSVYDDAGNQVGAVTSSTISPLAARSAICFAIVKKLFAQEGKTVQVPAEGALRPASVSLSLKFL